MGTDLCVVDFAIAVLVDFLDEALDGQRVHAAHILAEARVERVGGGGGGGELMHTGSCLPPNELLQDLKEKWKVLAVGGWVGGLGGIQGRREGRIGIQENGFREGRIEIREK